MGYCRDCMDGGATQSNNLPLLAVKQLQLNHLISHVVADGTAQEVYRDLLSCHIALIRPDTGLAGDIASETGFLASLESRPSEIISAEIICHNGSGRDLSTKLDRLFTSKTPPTALFVLRLRDVLAIMLYLLKRGQSVPDAISLIARDHNDLFDSMDPPITHYRFNVDTYSHRLSRLVLQLVNEGHVPNEPNLIFPDFVSGGTVKSLSK